MSNPVAFSQVVNTLLKNTFICSVTFNDGNRPADASGIVH